MPRGRTPAVKTEVNDKGTERAAVKTAIADLQVIIDSITGATTLGDLRGYTKDLTRVTRRIARILT